jgi:DNA gyrase subunit A
MIESSEQKIKNEYKVPLEEELKQSFLDYALSVIISRAIPDVRDGLKPVQRRIIYAMKELNLYHNKPFRKVARIVGEVLGKYHPHGDSSVYEALVRMAQDFVMRYPLIEGQGNFGSIDGDPAAQMRYIEARLSKIAEELLEDIDKETVEFRPNFDNTLKEPVYLPGKFPNLICNGTIGIAVGITTSIPPHNLNEVADALIALAKGELNEDNLINYIKGPDFPTGGKILNSKEEIKEIYKKGRGTITIESVYEIKEGKGGRNFIIIKEIPYQVYKADLIKKIAQLAKDGKLQGIADLRDESDKKGIRIVIETKKGTNPKDVVEKLRKLTNFRKNFQVNLMAVLDKQPKLYSLFELLNEFYKHRIKVITKKHVYLLKKAEKRLNIVNGLLIAINHIDSIIETIKNSKDAKEAKEKLMNNYKLNEKQAQAILDMKLSRLTGLEKEKLLKEKEELEQKIKEYKEIIENEQKKKEIFIKEMQELKEKYGDKRRTKLKIGLI